MQDQRDNGNDQQDVDQSAANVENAPAQDPGEQQNNEQNREDTHGFSLLGGRAIGRG
jgi:hypothetical protein